MLTIATTLNTSTMISTGYIAREFLVSTPVGICIQNLRNEGTHMLRHILVTPKQFCDITKLSLNDVNTIADEYSFCTKKAGGQLYVGHIDFFYNYKVIKMIEAANPTKSYEPFTEEDLPA